MRGIVMGGTALVAAAVWAQPRTAILSEGWRFRLEGETTARAVTVPHDWGVEKGFLKAGACPGQGDLPFVGKGYYRRAFDGFTPPTGGKTYLTLDGVQCRSVVKLNGKIVGGRPFGYASETINVTDALVATGNVLEVEAENVELSSRWYPGSGIFRDVTVRVCPRDHVKPNTLFVRTLTATEQEAMVAVSFEWTGGTSNYTFTVKNPRLWSPEKPSLYTLRLFGEDFRYGIRTAVFDPQKGFFLNGKHRQMRGVCMHHDLGPLGAAFDRGAALRQILLLKQMGCDAIRTSHNPPAAALLDLCDEFGMLVMDEAFDMWEVWKGDYSNFWKDWHQRDLENFVRRDRSHPCVVMWSIGNELGEFADKTPERMIRISKELNAIVKANDATRPVTFGCWVLAPMTNGCQNTVDAFGANYMPFKYATFLKNNPKIGLVGTETASCVSSRGEYFFPVVASPITCEADLKRRRDEGREKMIRGGQMSGYDLWGPHPNDYPPDVEFEFQTKNPQVYGEFVWTGFDYLGEPDPCAQTGGRSSYFGIFDLAGFPKDRYWLYKAQWCPEEPSAHILPHWTWPGREGEVTPVHVYTSGDEAELFVNGVSQGRQKRGKYQYRFVWNDVRYQPGELRVRTWRNGKDWAGQVVRTAGAPVRLVREDKRYGNLIFVTFTLKDKDGNVCPNDDRVVSFSTTKPRTRLVALCNGDPASREDFRGTSMRTFHGLLLAVVEGRSDGLVATLSEPFSAKTLEAQFRTPPPGYGEVPFWWWTGEKLDKERIREQLRELHAKGVTGTQVNYSHLMTDGWKTVPVEPSIFSEEWWSVFNDAAVESSKLGMGIGLSGYTLDWPGRDNLYRQLGISVDETRGRVLELKDGKVVPVVRDGTLDPLNPESAKRVIDRFFKPFWDRVPASAHDALNYFFQDELRLAGDRYVWSDDFPSEFRKRKGYDIVPALPLLFSDVVTKDAERIRLDYNDVMVALTEERYFKPIYEWHASRGKIYACDSATRGKNPIEFGDYMRSMRWYTAPGFDTPGKHADPVKCKMGSSIAHLYRRPRVWLEGYHSQGWQANTASIFDATAHNYVYGANLLNLHGLYYSTYGGWWEWAPPCYHFHQPYWALMGTTLKYFERLSYMLTRGTHVADVAIVSPQEPCVVDPERANKTSVPLAHALVDRLAVNGTTDCDFIDSDSILNATIEKDADGTALVAAGERYRVLILPDMFAMRPMVRAKLDDFAKAGGRIIDAKRAEDVKFPLVAQPDVVGNRGLKYHHRQLPDCDIYYLVDWDGKTDIHLRAKGTVEYWDLWTGEKRVAPPTGEPVLAVVKHVDAAASPRQDKEVVITIRRGEAAPSTLNVAGPWNVTFLPTLDNKWGDYRLPAFTAKIGPEVRAMRWLEENRTENLGYGPQFDGYEFSWRYGVFDKPGAQNDHHGLNRVISDYFFVLGRYSTAWPAPYDVVPSEKDKNLETRYTTYVYAPYDLQAKIGGGEERPQAIFPETAGKYAAPVVQSLRVGDQSCKVGDTVALKTGYTPVEITYKGCGRAALVFSDVTLGRSYRWPTPMPLAMKWHAQGNRLNYDPFGGKHKKGTFVASVPPGTVDAVVDVNGKLIKKEIKDGELILEIEFAPGLVGGNAFKDVVKLVTKPAEMELGDWARYEGLRCYSGGAVYRKTVDVPATFRKDARRVVLDLGNVGCAAEVAVNGKTVGVRTCPPWTVDVTDVLKDGANDLAVTVYNTLNNHYQTIPTRYKVSTAEAPSGLIGPVVIR